MNYNIKLDDYQVETLLQKLEGSPLRDIVVTQVNEQNEAQSFNPEEWIFEFSSGYPGYRNKKTADWLYQNEWIEKLNKLDPPYEKRMSMYEKVYGSEALEEEEDRIADANKNHGF